jgi:hypothetical protein
MKCGTVHCRDATVIFFATEVQGEVFAHSHVVALKVTGVCEIDCLACQDEFFVNNPLDVKENNEHALDFALHLSLSPFSVSVSMDIPLNYPCTAHAFFLERFSNHCQGVNRTFSGICTKFDSHSPFLYRIHREIASALSTGRTLLPRNSIFLLLILIC